MPLFSKSKKNAVKHSDFRDLPEGVEYAPQMKPIVNTTGRFGPNGLLYSTSQRKHSNRGREVPSNYQVPEIPPPQSYKQERMREQPTSTANLLRQLRDKLPGFRDKKLSWRRSAIDAPGTWYDEESVPVDGYTIPHAKKSGSRR